MAKQCAICDKSSRLFGKYNKLRGKYNPAPKVRKYPNLQWLSIPEDVRHKKYRPLAGKRVLACAKCIKTLAKPPRIKKKKLTTTPSEPKPEIKPITKKTTQIKPKPKPKNKTKLKPKAKIKSKAKPKTKPATKKN